MQANTLGAKYLMAVPSSMQGADYVIATGRPVLYLGGFMGQDQVVTAGQLARLVASGALRYVYWDARGGGRGFGQGAGQGAGNQSAISTWVTAQCKAVQGFDTAAQNLGAPDGTGGAATNAGGNGFGGGAGLQVTLYDCVR